MLRITFAILILLSSIACSLNASNKKVKKQLTPTRFEQRVNELIAQMTLDEKISQLMNGIRRYRAIRHSSIRLVERSATRRGTQRTGYGVPTSHRNGCHISTPR